MTNKIGLAIPWLEEFSLVFKEAHLDWTAGSQDSLRKILSSEKKDDCDIILLSSKLPGILGADELFEWAMQINCVKRVALLESDEDELASKLHKTGWEVLQNGITPIEKVTSLLGLHFKECIGNIVSVFTPAGSHTAVISMELAYQLNRRGNRTLLVDSGSGAEISRRLKWSEGKGLAYLISAYEGQGTITKQDIEQSLINWSGGVLIPGYSSLNDFNRLTEDFAIKFFKKAQEMFSSIVVDTSTIALLPLTFSALCSSTHIITPYRAKWVYEINNEQVKELNQVKKDIEEKVIPVAVNMEALSAKSERVVFDMARSDEPIEKWTGFGEPLLKRITFQEGGASFGAGITEGKSKRGLFSVFRSF
ncbi:ParA family protein [Heliorestis acidaminivorans]|uniref:ParA family protein n=1 Tax=Heliorestis acidaminivorans TaxID=553427 RepID=A0A6I0EYV6_9FIRM|nr:ParA family protein [Heliorestis acidaminivorans]KAB2951992.1 ParA family protein [Heliorestis acidaminivorans]